MADTGIFASTTEVQAKVGANASSTSNVETFINQYMTESESLINVETLRNWTDAFSALNVDVKGILKLAASSRAAIMVLNYDLSLSPLLLELQTRIDVLWNDYREAIRILKTLASQEFMDGETA